MRRQVFFQDILVDVLNNYVENRVVNRVINTSLHDQTRYKDVLSEKGKKQLKKVKYNTLIGQDTCPISLNKFEKDEILIQLPCKHVFSQESILNWVQNEHANCPICKFKLDSVKQEVQADERVNEDIRNELRIPPSINRVENQYVSLPSITRTRRERTEDYMLYRALRNSMTDF